MAKENYGNPILLIPQKQVEQKVEIEHRELQKQAEIKNAQPHEVVIELVDLEESPTKILFYRQLAQKAPDEPFTAFLHKDQDIVIARMRDALAFDQMHALGFMHDTSIEFGDQIKVEFNGYTVQGESVQPFEPRIVGEMYKKIDKNGHDVFVRDENSIWQSTDDPYTLKSEYVYNSDELRHSAAAIFYYLDLQVRPVSAPSVNTKEDTEY